MEIGGFIFSGNIWKLKGKGTGFSTLSLNFVMFIILKFAKWSHGCNIQHERRSENFTIIPRIFKKTLNIKQYHVPKTKEQAYIEHTLIQ